METYSENSGCLREKSSYDLSDDNECLTCQISQSNDHDRKNIDKNVLNINKNDSNISVCKNLENSDKIKNKLLLETHCKLLSQENSSNSKIKNETESSFDFDLDFSPEHEQYRPLSKKLKNENVVEIKDCTDSSCQQNGNKLSSHNLNGCDKEKMNNSNENQTKSIVENANVVTSNETDPFELSDDERLEKVKFRPLKRKMNIVNSISDNNGNRDMGTVSSANVCFLDDDSSSLDANHKKFFSNPPASENSNPPALENKLDESSVESKTPPRVVYIHSEELNKKTNALIRIENRAELVHSLIRTYGLLRYIKVVEPRPATDFEILGFHCPDYIACLRRCDDFTDSEEIPDTLNNEAEEYGLSYDCPQQSGVFETASLISGASITAAESLLSGDADIAINWYGGWHHAKRDSASGFCYINDIVLATLKLREKFDQILYVDLDLHHGDGVEEAFETTTKVLTVSFHKFASGFFPGSGNLSSVGSGKGKFHSVNVPLKDGIRDTEFFAVFKRVMKMVKAAFTCEAVVVQCGADSLSEDPMASFNLTHIGLAKCVCFLLAWRLPTLLLGGGGYNIQNTAKTWTFLTGLAAGKKLPLDIPEHEHLLEYGPGYELTTSAGNRKDCNSPDYLKHVLTNVHKNLRHLK